MMGVPVSPYNESSREPLDDLWASLGFGAVHLRLSIMRYVLAQEGALWTQA